MILYIYIWIDYVTIYIIIYIWWNHVERADLMDLNRDLSSGVIKHDLLENLKSTIFTSLIVAARAARSLHSVRKRVPLGTFDYRGIWWLDMPQKKHVRISQHYTEWLIACFFGSWKAKKGIDLTHHNNHLGIYSSFGIVVPSAACQPTVPWLVPNPNLSPTYCISFSSLGKTMSHPHKTAVEKWI